jgi:hypothetical protein
MFATFTALFLAASAPPQAAHSRPAPGVRTYAEGQVWRYRARPGEGRSLLKIQKIEVLPEHAAHGPVYHISVIGLKLAPNIVGALPHAPVSRETLDASVTHLSRNRPEFPAVEPGIEEWRRAQGGVFTITVAQIAEFLDRSTRGLPAD